MPFLAVRKYFHFHKPKAFLLQKAYELSSKTAFFTYKKPFIRTNLSFFPSKATLSHPPPSIPTTLNLLFAKNTAVLLLFALILCCKARTSHRFKSSPAISGKVEIPGAAGYMMMAGYFRRNHVSSGDLNRGRRTESRVLFGYFLHDAKSDNSFPFREAPRFFKPRSSPLKQQLPTNKIKSFRRLLAALFLLLSQQIFAASRLLSAAAPPLKLSCLLETWSPCSRPFAILPVSAVSDAQKLATGNFLHVRAESLSRFCKPRISSPKQQLPTNKIKSF